MSKRTLVLVNDMARQRAVQAVQEAPAGFSVTVAEPRRSLDQNARLWALLADVSAQVNWHGKHLSSEDWKHVFSSALKKMEVVPNLDGTGFVALGLSTSRMSKRELGDLMTLIEAFGAERGVEWSETERVSTFHCMDPQRQREIAAERRAAEVSKDMRAAAPSAAEREI